MGIQPETPQWASDGTEIVDPPGGTKLTGILPGARFPAQYLNWILNLLTQWVLYVLGAEFATLRWGGRVWCPGGAGTDSTHPNVTVDAIETVVLNGGTLAALTPHTYVLADYDPTGPGYPLAALANSQHYFCYVGFNAGAAVYQFSTTGPVDAAASGGGPAWKNGFVGTWRYLGCFKTDGAGVPYPFRACRGRYTFRRSARPLADFYVMPGGVPGSAIVATDIPLGAFVPSHARMAALWLHATSSNATHFYGVSLVTKPDTGGTSVGLSVPPTSGAAAGAIQGYGELETDSAQTVQYSVTNAAVALDAYAGGFVE